MFTDGLQGVVSDVLRICGEGLGPFGTRGWLASPGSQEAGI